MSIDWDNAPSASDLARERYEDNAERCANQGHSFDSSRETNEAIGRCFHCGISVEGAEAEEEDETPLAFADVPQSDRDAYLAALDAEAVRENR